MIPLLKVHKPAGVERQISDVWDSGFIGEGDYVSRFESKFAEYVGNENTCIVNSCTSALSLASMLCGVEEGDEVIVSPMTCLATNMPFAQLGAKLVWVDVDPATGNIDPASVERHVTPKTKAIVGVHWGGQPFDIGAIHNIAARFGVRVIEDAAHALGATYKDRRIGSHSDCVCFSFQAVKHLTTGDGGALCSRSRGDTSRAKRLRWFGVDRSHPGARWEMDISELGFKYHMNNISASIGLLQMEYLDKIVASHRRNAQYYVDHIDNRRVRKLEVDCRSSACWLYTILVENREDFQSYMHKNGIACEPLHYRNDTYTVFREFRRPFSELPGVLEFSKDQINIPVGWWLTDEQRHHIVNVVNQY
jgi:dTDP-4-amino-4,6-dideoxygalactose transaminase